MKKYILILLITAFIIPSVVSASWWNPFNWFSKGTVETPTTDISVVETVPDATAPVPVTPTPKPTVPQVVQTITVQDPALQKQINELIAENAALKAQISNLTEQLSQIKKTPVSVVVSEPECSSDINVEASAKELVIGTSKSVTFYIHTESNCEMDDEEVILKVFKDNAVYFTPVTIALEGAIKSGSTWKIDTLYTRNFIRNDFGSYDFDFIFDGKKITLPLEIEKGIVPPAYR